MAKSKSTPHTNKTKPVIELIPNAVYSLESICTAFRIDIRNLSGMLNAGEIKSNKMGVSRYVTGQSLLDYFNNPKAEIKGKSNKK